MTAPVWQDPTVRIYGDVHLGEGVSFWPYSVVRAETTDVHIGAMTNIQDFVMIHAGPVRIGAFCSITHHCTIHLAEIGDNCLIGINSTIMDGAVIGANSIVAGHSIVPEGMVVPPNSIVMGSPGKVRRTQDCSLANRLNAWWYWRNAQAYARGDHTAMGTAAERQWLADKQREEAALAN